MCDEGISARIKYRCQALIENKVDKGCVFGCNHGMTKNEMRRYAARRTKILKMLKTLTQTEVAKKLGMKRQRVHQIAKEYG